MPSKNKPCIDCGKLISAKSIRCMKCNSIAVAAGFRLNDKQIYREHIPAATIQVEYTDSNTVVITAYQDAARTQMKYFRDKFDAIIQRIKTEITAYTFDPLVYDSKQDNNRITINRNTVIQGE